MEGSLSSLMILSAGVDDRSLFVDLFDATTRRVDMATAVADGLFSVLFPNNNECKPL